MITIDMEMPTCCNECFALDDHGDYPCCLITQESRGYNFDIFTKRMNSCPLRNNHLENNKTRLIDADALYNKYQEEMTRLLSSTNMKNISAEAISLLCGSTLIREAPTVSSLSGAHLLTLEEADEASHVWMEVIPHILLGIRQVRLVPVDATACMVYTFGSAQPTCYNACLYGSAWRCWSSKPTVEQMEKEKWE